MNITRQSRWSKPSLFVSIIHRFMPIKCFELIAHGGHIVVRKLTDREDSDNDYVTEASVNVKFHNADKVSEYLRDYIGGDCHFAFHDTGDIKETLFDYKISEDASIRDLIWQDAGYRERLLERGSVTCGSPTYTITFRKYGNEYFIDEFSKERYELCDKWAARNFFAKYVEFERGIGADYSALDSR